MQDRVEATPELAKAAHGRISAGTTLTLMIEVPELTLGATQSTNRDIRSAMHQAGVVSLAAKSRARGRGLES